MNDKTFLYKNYSGSIEFSIDDDCLYGRILFVRDLVSYEAEQLGQLRIALENAVDNYLESCEREGFMPDKPLNGSFNVRLSPELHRAIAMEAARIGTSLNDLIVDCVEARMYGQKRQKAA